MMFWLNSFDCLFKSFFISILLFKKLKVGFDVGVDVFLIAFKWVIKHMDPEVVLF
jgi:hypothetical protein